MEAFLESYSTFQSTLSVLMQTASLGAGSGGVDLRDVFELMSRLGLVASVGPALSSKAGVRWLVMVGTHHYNTTKPEPYNSNVIITPPHKPYHNQKTPTPRTPQQQHHKPRNTNNTNPATATPQTPQQQQHEQGERLGGVLPFHGRGMQRH